jgi:hypothetical protein
MNWNCVVTDYVYGFVIFVVTDYLVTGVYKLVMALCSNSLT